MRVLSALRNLKFDVYEYSFEPTSKRKKQLERRFNFWIETAKTITNEEKPIWYIFCEQSKISINISFEEFLNRFNKEKGL